MWRARLDRAARRRIKLRSLIPIALTLAAVITMVLQFTHVVRTDGLGVLILLVLILRRRWIGRW
jgi:hypothetical protein